jgi:hypothetical protein
MWREADYFCEIGAAVAAALCRWEVKTSGGVEVCIDVRICPLEMAAGVGECTSCEAPWGSMNVAIAARVDEEGRGGRRGAVVGK